MIKIVNASQQGKQLDRNVKNGTYIVPNCQNIAFILVEQDTDTIVSFYENEPPTVWLIDEFLEEVNRSFTEGLYPMVISCDLEIKILAK